VVVYIVFLCAILFWGLLYRTRGRTGFPSQTKPPKNADDKLHSNNNDNVPENSVQVPKAASSSIVQTYMSTFFRRHGVFVTRHPLLVLCASLLVPILLCIGLIRFKVETRPEKVLNLSSYDSYNSTTVAEILIIVYNGGIRIVMRLTNMVNILSICI